MSRPTPGRAATAHRPASGPAAAQNRHTPGQAAQKTGFSLDTLRYYERIGLLDGVARTAGGQRVFSDDDLSWLGILRCLRDTGMPIAQMRRYAELARDEQTLAQRLALLEEHDRAVGERIMDLAVQREHVRQKIRYYRSLRQGAE
jgi:DNA-binding transcriptional MerR regulator